MAEANPMLRGLLTKNGCVGGEETNDVGLNEWEG